MYRHSTPKGCSYLNTPFSIDIAPLRGETVLENFIEIRRNTQNPDGPKKSAKSVQSALIRDSDNYPILQILREMRVAPVSQESRNSGPSPPQPFQSLHAAPVSCDDRTQYNIPPLRPLISDTRRVVFSLTHSNFVLSIPSSYTQKKH